MVGIGAAPGYGKSALVHQIAIQACLWGIPVVHLDLEHSNQFLLLRLLSCMSKMSIENVRDRIMSGVLEIPERLRDYRILRRDTPQGMITPVDIQREISILSHEERNVLVVIDSIQKLPYLQGANRRESVDVWIREIEHIKNTFPVTIVCISELSRGEGGAKNYDEPHLGALKESGDLEYSCEQVLFLSPASKTSDVYFIRVPKNRYGKTGKIDAGYSQKNFIHWRWEEVEF